MKIIHGISAALAAVLLGCLPASAQGDALAAFAANMASGKASFSYSFSSGSLKGSGSATVQGECFTLKAGSLEMTCNGSTLWSVDREAREVVIEPVDSPETAGAFNPALLVSCIGEAFDVKSSQPTTASGHAAVRYVLVPETSAIEIREVIAVLAADGSALYSVKVTTKDGGVTSFTIPSFSFVPKTTPADYTIKDSAFGSSYVVTDLR